MTPRENLINLYRKKGYDHAPCHFDLCPSQIDVYREKTGSEKGYGEYFGFPEIYVRDLDIKKIPDSEYEKYYRNLAPGAKIDIWGVAREPGSKDCAHMTYMRHPMENFECINEFENYPYPDYINGDWQMITDDVAEIHKKGYAAKASMACTIWEIGWYLRGMEQLMTDMIVNPELAEYHLDRVTQIACHRAEKFAKAGVDIILTGDDVGMQNSLMMSEDMYCTWIKPRFEKIIKAAKNQKPDILIEYHSCGYVLPLIPHFIEAGIDILNPVQPECMDFETIYKLFGDRISFKGTIGTQTTMPFGTPDEIKKIVRRNLDIAGKSGGLFCSPTHLIEPEVPWDNIIAYVEACKEYL